MRSIVEEVQRDALNHDLSVTELLQKCLVVATKLGQNEFVSWARVELDGYRDKDVPEYRIVRGAPQVFNPYHGYQPLYFGDPKYAKQISEMKFNQPIGELEHYLRQGEKSGSDSFQVSFSPDFEKILMDGMEIRLQPSLHVNASQLRKIMDAVRKVVLEWSLKLETDGILGEGMSFSPEEKEKAQSVTYNIKNYIQGNIEHSQIQVESSTSTQQATVKEFNITQLKDVLKALRSSLEEIGIDNDAKAELLAELVTLESQADSPKPKASIIRESLSFVRQILQGAAGNLVASGLLNQIGCLFGP